MTFSRYEYVTNPIIKHQRKPLLMAPAGHRSFSLYFADLATTKTVNKIFHLMQTRRILPLHVWRRKRKFYKRRGRMWYNFCKKWTREKVAVVDRFKRRPQTNHDSVGKTSKIVPRITLQTFVAGKFWLQAGKPPLTNVHVDQRVKAIYPEQSHSLPNASDVDPQHHNFESLNLKKWTSAA